MSIAGRTYIGESVVRKLAIPLVLDLLDLALVVVGNGDDGVDLLLLADTLDDVSGGQVHFDGVAALGDLVAETLDLAKGGLEAVLVEAMSVVIGHGGARHPPIVPRTASCPGQW